MREKYWGIFSDETYPSLTTPDKQLQAHGLVEYHNMTINAYGIGTIKRGEAEFWQSMAGTIDFLHDGLGRNILTLVLDFSPFGV